MFGYEEELQDEIAKLKTENEKLKLRLSVVSSSLLALEKFKGGTYYSGTHNEFRTVFLGDWNDIESALANNDC
jgi:hypothetical protein